MSVVLPAPPFTEPFVPALPGWRAVESLRLGSHGEAREQCCVAEEVPVAFHYCGMAHAVMMATPSDLIDYALGFSLSETIIRQRADISTLKIREAQDALVIEITLAPACLHRYLADRRVRQLRGHPGCGICGKEDLRDVQRSPPNVAPGEPVAASRMQAALEALREHQHLSRRTRGAHAAAWVNREGAIQVVREDVGRHNALDKLIGAGLNGAFSRAEGFCLITSRCSFEMVQKAATAGFGTLVSASAPTGLAIRTAADAGLTLFSLTHGGGRILYTAPASNEVLPDGCEAQA